MPPGSNIVSLSDATLPAFLQDSLKPVLIDFQADWCGPCLALAPIIEELAREWEGKIAIASLDVDENAISARKFGVMSIPTLMLFKAGRPLERIIGLVSKAEIQKRVKNALTV